VEEELKRLFPGTRVLRLDRDTTRARGSHGSILSAFEKGEADILLGTQMVAKGLDFVSVTLVGVISADVALNLPDFRAAERTFNLLTQVAGRAGRGSREGLVIIQTYNPDHYSIISAKDHDYLSFYKQEILLRRELGYPPFNHLLNLRLEGEDEEVVIQQAEDLGYQLRLRNVEFGCQVLGPAACALSRIRGRYRWQILIKGKKPSALRSLVQKALQSSSLPSSTRLILDMDPVMML
jgi:primosomal protein N' (replication factor Y)